MGVDLSIVDLQGGRKTTVILIPPLSLVWMVGFSSDFRSSKFEVLGFVWYIKL